MRKYHWALLLGINILVAVLVGMLYSGITIPRVTAKLSVIPKPTSSSTPGPDLIDSCKPIAS